MIRSVAVFAPTVVGSKVTLIPSVEPEVSGDVEGELLMVKSAASGPTMMIFAPLKKRLPVPEFPIVVVSGAVAPELIS